MPMGIPRSAPWTPGTAGRGGQGNDGPKTDRNLVSARNVCVPRGCSREDLEVSGLLSCDGCGELRFSGDLVQSTVRGERGIYCRGCQEVIELEAADEAAGDFIRDAELARDDLRLDKGDCQPFEREGKRNEHLG